MTQENPQVDLAKTLEQAIAGVSEQVAGQHAAAANKAERKRLRSILSDGASQLEEQADQLKGGRTKRFIRAVSPALKRFWGWGVLVAVFVGLAVYIAYINRKPGDALTFESEAALLAFAGAVALGIERTIELLWTVLGQTPVGGWWPMSKIKKYLTKAEAAINADLLGENGVTAKIGAALTEAQESGDYADNAKEEIAQIASTVAQAAEDWKTEMAEIEDLAPGSSRVALVADVADRASTQLDSALRVVNKVNSAAGSALAKAEQNISATLKLVTSFQDNSPRRILSLLLGALLGMGVAAFLKLNLFVAALGEDLAGPLAAGAGVLVTGIVLGFGANPTHEVIKGLQRYKERRSSEDGLTLPGDRDSSPLGGTAEILVRHLAGQATSPAVTPGNVSDKDAGLRVAMATYQELTPDDLSRIFDEVQNPDIAARTAPVPVDTRKQVAQLPRPARRRISIRSTD